MRNILIPYVLLNSTHLFALVGDNFLRREQTIQKCQNMFFSLQIFPNCLRLLCEIFRINLVSFRNKWVGMWCKKQIGKKDLVLIYGAKFVLNFCEREMFRQTKYLSTTFFVWQCLAADIPKSAGAIWERGFPKIGQVALGVKLKLRPR